MTATNLNLSDTISQFVADCDLAHQFTNGGPTDTVQTASGTYPSFAKVVADNEQALSINQAALAATQAALLAAQQQLAVVITSAVGTIAKKFTFPIGMSWLVQHNMETSDYIVTLKDVNGEIFEAPIQPIDDNSFLVQFGSPEGGDANVIFFLNS
jgi:hypothetical protein